VNPNTMNLGAISDVVGHVPQARHRFYDDPVGFADACIKWPVGQRLTAYQREILAAVPKRKRVAVRGPHGLGKSMAAAILVLWFATTREASGIDWKVASTAGAWRQLERYLWPEIIKWARRLDWAAVGCEPWNERTELLSLNIKLKHGQAFAVASDNYALIEGAHADSILYLLDESKSIIPAIFDAAEGAFAGAGAGSGLEAFAFAASTPGEPVGRFFDIHARKPGFEDWWTRHVTVDESIAAGRISQDWVDQRRKQWGKDPVSASACDPLRCVPARKPPVMLAPFPRVPHVLALSLRLSYRTAASSPSTGGDLCVHGCSARLRCAAAPVDCSRPTVTACAVRTTTQVQEVRNGYEQEDRGNRARDHINGGHFPQLQPGRAGRPTHSGPRAEAHRERQGCVPTACRHQQHQGRRVSRRSHLGTARRSDRDPYQRRQGRRRRPHPDSVVGSQGWLQAPSN